MRLSRHVVGGLLVGSVASVSCQPRGQDVASSPLGGQGSEVCPNIKRPDEPSMVSWDASALTSLKSGMTKGGVVVRYRVEGCKAELEPLPYCLVKGAKYQYQWSPGTEKIEARSSKEVFAELPLGAANLSGKVSAGKMLRVDARLAGLAELPLDVKLDRDALEGDCDKATHVVARFYLGGFTMVSGDTTRVSAKASVFGLGGGGETEAGLSVENSVGQKAACEAAQEKEGQQAGCSFPLRIGLRPLRGGSAPVVQATPRAEPRPVAGGRQSSGPPTAAPELQAKLVEDISWIREPRRSTARSLTLAISDVSQAEELWKKTDKMSAERVTLTRQLADAYVRLEISALAEKARAEGTQDHGLADKSQKTAEIARRGAIGYYRIIANEYKNYPSLDEVLYYLAYEYEQAQKFDEARKVYFQLINDRPQSKYIPNAYLAFGELFFVEAQGDPSKLELAKQAYLKVLEYPETTNRVGGYAAARLGQSLAALGDKRGAATSFKNARDYVGRHPDQPGAAALLKLLP
jgi:TolA-binding protein